MSHTHPINAETKLYGIFGKPVSHSLSPRMHNALFQHFKINAVYLAFEVEPEALGLALEAFRSLGMKGANITIPHKEAAVNYVDEIPDDLDRAVGALNTLVNRGGKLYGYNTDGPGFLMALKEELSFNPEFKTALVLGSGGGARSALFSLARAGADKIFLWNRTLERAKGLKEYMAGHFPELELDVLPSVEEIRGQKLDLVVNATSLGMREEDELPVDLKLLSGKPVVYDLVYAPAETRFLKEAKKLGLRGANGLGMLVAQAALSFQIWTGKSEGVRELMLESLKK